MTLISTWGRRVISHNFDRHCYHYSLNRCLIGLKFAYWNITSTTGFFSVCMSIYLNCRVFQNLVLISWWVPNTANSSSHIFNAYTISLSCTIVIHCLTCSHLLLHFLPLVYLSFFCEKESSIALKASFFTVLDIFKWSSITVLHTNTVHFIKHWCSLNKPWSLQIVSFKSLIYKVNEKARKFSFMPL